jgi:hypothetical protein
VASGADTRYDASTVGDSDPGATSEHELTMKRSEDQPIKPPYRVVPEDDRRPPEVTAQIRALETQKSELVRKSPTYREDKRALNREIYRLAKIGLPTDLSWRNNDGRPAFLPRDQKMVAFRLSQDQLAFCQRMSPRGNVSMGVRACIDFTMASRQLPALPPEFEDD